MAGLLQGREYNEQSGIAKGAALCPMPQAANGTVQQPWTESIIRLTESGQVQYTLPEGIDIGNPFQEYVPHTPSCITR